MPSPASTSPKTAPPRSRSSSPDEPLAKTTSPKDGAADVAGSASSAATVVHLDTATKAYSRPIQPVVDKHRQSKVRFRPLETKPKHYGLPLRTTQPSSSSKDRASPVTPVASVRPSTSRGASSSSSAAAALSPRQTDQSLPFAHSMSPPLDLGPTSPTTLASPTALASPTGPASSVTNIPTTTATDNNNSTKLVPCSTQSTTRKLTFLLSFADHAARAQWMLLISWKKWLRLKCAPITACRT